MVHISSPPPNIQWISFCQIFYEAARGKDMWYDPVFRVETLDGRNVWCKVRPTKRTLSGRHHFFSYVCSFCLAETLQGSQRSCSWDLSALGLGQWCDIQRILDHHRGGRRSLMACLSLCGSRDHRRSGKICILLLWKEVMPLLVVAHYYPPFLKQRYLGGLLCTADGSLPNKSQLESIWPVFQSAGIEPWELFVVNNDPNAPGSLDSGPPPLDFYRKEVLASIEELLETS